MNHRATHSNTVIENAGTTIGALPTTKLFTTTTLLCVSFVSVILPAVSRLTCTTPEGAPTPENVIGNPFVLLKFNTTKLRRAPSAKANVCR